VRGQHIDGDLRERHGPVRWRRLRRTERGLTCEWCDHLAVDTHSSTQEIDPVNLWDWSV
jgi:hypothetical protein